jgi:hypothetical protein
MLLALIQCSVFIKFSKQEGNTSSLFHRKNILFEVPSKGRPTLLLNEKKILQKFSFNYPSASDVLVMSFQNILSAVNPATITGRAYTLSNDEMFAATKILDDMI